MRGSVRRHALDGMASVALDSDGLVIAPLDATLQAQAAVRLPFEELAGATHCADAGGTLILHLAGGDQVTGTGDARAALLAGDILHRGRTMPEIARAVRAIGGRRTGEAQAAFFAPLLDARRSAVPGGTPALEAFDAGALRGAFEHRLATLAEAREPERAAARRALEARLLDAAESLFASLPRLDAAAAASRTADAAVALHRWREWVGVLRLVFERADAAWVAVQQELDAPARPTPAATPAISLAQLRRRWIG